MKKLFIILVAALLYIHSTFAVKVSSLYQAEIPVTSQTADERELAVREGFLQVLMKVSGDNQIEKNPVIHTALKRADYYVQEFSYTMPSTNDSQYLLHVKYEINDINKLLKKAGLAFWGQNRPLILVWLVVTDEQHHSQIVATEESLSILDEMRTQAKKSGLPMIFPMMDVADLEVVSLEDVSIKSLPLLKEASKRYAPDGLLIGHIQQGENQYLSDWQLILNNDQWTWTFSNDSPKSTVTTIIGQVSQTLSKRFVVKTVDTTQTWLKLEITNIVERDDLIQLMQYLKQLTPVQQVELTQVSGSKVKVSVLIRGSLVAFQQHATIGQHLIPKSQDNNQLIYEWVR